MRLKAVLPGPIPSQGRSCTICSAAIQTLMRKLFELSWRPASRLITRMRSGSTWVIANTSSAPPKTASSSGNSRRARGGQLRVWRNTSNRPMPPSAATIPSQPPRL